MCYFLVMKKETINLQIIRWDEMPDFDLYIDQVTSIIETSLGDLDDNDDEVLTKAMINNYVKHGVLKAPVKKKYNREHVAYLMMIVLLKRVYALDEIKKLIQMQLDKQPLNESYDMFCTVFENTLANKQQPQQEMFAQVVSSIVDKIKVQRVIAAYQQTNAKKA